MFIEFADIKEGQRIRQTITHIASGDVTIYEGVVTDAAVIDAGFVMLASRSLYHSALDTSPDFEVTHEVLPPAEPTNVGAVVQDDQGHYFVRVSDAISAKNLWVWVPVDNPADRVPWGHIHNPRIISEGAVIDA